MDLIGAKLLFAIILVILIVFAGAVPPAYRNLLDTWYGRGISALFVLTVAKQAGWWLGILTTVALLVLMPMSMREGFMNPKASFNLGLETAADKEKFRGGVLETAADKEEEEERLSSIEEPFSLPAGASMSRQSPIAEPFWGSADKKQPVPRERRKQWFIEEVMDEHPETIETDGVETQAPQ